MSTGLNFQTCTIVNSGKYRKNSGSLSGKEVDMFTKTTMKDINGADIDAVKVAGVGLFQKYSGGLGVQAVRYAEAYDPEGFVLEVTIPDVTVGTDEKKAYVRLDISIGLEGSEEFLYAAPWIQKSRPFWIDAEVSVNSTTKKASGSEIAKALKKNIDKSNAFYIEHELATVTVDGAKLTISGADEFQRVRAAKLVQYNAIDGNEDILEEYDPNNTSATVFKLTNMGRNGFGTYDYMIRNVQVRSAANYQPDALRADEHPVLGYKYAQIIVDYCMPASNDGTQVVGNRLNSTTQHVFWINTSTYVTDEEGEIKLDSNKKPVMLIDTVKNYFEALTSNGTLTGDVTEDEIKTTVSEGVISTKKTKSLLEA